MTSASLPLLLASATVSLVLSFQPASSQPDYDPELPSGWPLEKSFSWNTPFRFPHHAPDALTRARLQDMGEVDLDHFARLQRSEGPQRSLFSLLLWPHLSRGVQLGEKSPYRRDARGMKRKMFWSPLGYVPHRDIEASDSEKDSGSSAGQGAALLRYG